MLSQGECSEVFCLLQNSTKLRQKFSLRFFFTPKQIQIRHAYWVDVIERICKLAQSKMADVAAHDQHGQGKFTLLNDPEDSEKCPSDCPIAEQGQPEEPEYSTTSADKVLFLRFFEEIESCVAQAEALWRRVALTELDLSTASICIYPVPCAGIYSC